MLEPVNNESRTPSEPMFRGSSAESIEPPLGLRYNGQQALQYLLELRRRFMWVVACFIIIFLGCYSLSNNMFHILLSQL